MRDSNSDNGIIGEGTLPSTTTSAIRQVTPRIKLPKTRGFRQPRLTDSMNPTTTPPSPRVASSAPDQSIRLALAMRLSGIRQSEMVITANASGRLMKNIDRQETCSTSQPPRTGPMAVVIVVKPDQVPIARPRLFSSKVAPIIARLPGTRSAAPAP